MEMAMIDAEDKKIEQIEGEIFGGDNVIKVRGARHLCGRTEAVCRVAELLCEDVSWDYGQTRCRFDYRA